ncbi:Acyl-CoA reductase [Burkholderia sp. D7]|nr:Acyl-CoA reductase [Burkholderia sp. D7]
MKQYSYVNGDFLGASDERIELEVPSPPTWGRAQILVQASKEDLDFAVEAAHQAFLAHRNSKVSTRVKWLLAASEEIERASKDLADIIVEDIGKPRRAALFEVGRVVEFLRATATCLPSLHGEAFSFDPAADGSALFGYTRRVPYGVVAAITPFNAPANLLSQKLAPALAAGNAVVVKPHPAGTRTALELARMFGQAGLPAGLFNVVVGDVEPAKQLAAHNKVAAITFTGGCAAGDSLVRAAGAKKFVAELGANAANIVLADADLADAATRIARAAFEASGQQCISAQRIIVEDAVWDEFCSRFVDAAKSLKSGDPREPDTDLGPMISVKQAQRVMAMVEDALAKGAEALLMPRIDGCVVSPGVLAHVPKNSRIWCEEVFGPIAALTRVSSPEEALSVANDSEFGLQSAVFTRNLGRADQFARGLETGSLWINEASRFRLDTYPFGGVKRSGFGREGVKYALDEMSQLQFVGIRPVY